MGSALGMCSAYSYESKPFNEQTLHTPALRADNLLTENPSKLPMQKMKI